MKKTDRNINKQTIDAVDSRIITLLQKDGRLSNIEIAKKLDVSEATVRTRIKRLIDSKFIQIVAVCDPYRLGFEMTGDLYIHVEIKKLDAVIVELKKYKELWYIIMTSGESTINAEFIARTREELNDLIYNRLSRIDGVLRIETSLIMQYIKRDYGYGTAHE